MQAVDARRCEDETGQHESAHIGRPPVVAVDRLTREAARLGDRVAQDEQPQCDEKSETDREQPEARQHPHHGEQQERVCNHDEDEQGNAAPRLAEIEVTEPGVSTVSSAVTQVEGVRRSCACVDA